MNEDNVNSAILKIYPAGTLVKVAIEIAKTLQNYLKVGNAKFKAYGFSSKEGPLFLIREGSGEVPFIRGEDSEENFDVSEDRPIYGRANVYFRDDISQVVPPYIKITSLIPEGEFENYDPFQDISNWVIVFELVAGESSGTVSRGESPETSDLILSGALTKLLSNREAMQECGIRNYSLKIANPSQMVLETKNGITLTGEVYSEKFPGAIYSEV